MSKFIQISAWLLTCIGCIILFRFLQKASIDGYTISFCIPTDYAITGQFGDFIGGVVGTLFALAGTLLIFLSFLEQTKENRRIAFEASFFEMIRLHRENVSELKYNKYKNGNIEAYENRQVINLIFKEFTECYRDVKKFSNSTDINYYIRKKYQKNLAQIVAKASPKISVIEMAIIDISWSIVFYGLSEDGLAVLRKSFLKRYNPDYYLRLLYYIRLKPKKSNTLRYQNWEILRHLPLSQLHPLIEELYKKRTNPNNTNGLSESAKQLKVHLTYEKYYGGHQFRLGHYFRHLYQSYIYLYEHKKLSEKKKYFYGKLLRAQLSTYEQGLLFINSISTLGMKWELNRENVRNNEGLITYFHLIKNLPDEHIFGIVYKNYYPKVKYEFKKGIDI